MTEKDLINIQRKIGYNFKNIQLLQQAFIRESYILQDREHQSNEYLSWIGSSLLEFIVKQKVLTSYSRINELKEFKVDQTNDCYAMVETYLSDAFLSQQIEIQDLNRFLVMGVKDKKRKAQKMFSVKSELIRAIIGAIAVDCNYNLFTIRNTIDLLLDLDFYMENEGQPTTNYLSLLHQWARIGNYPMPRYEFNANSFSFGSSFFQCTVVIEQINRTFSSKGKNRSEARMNAAKMAYEYLKKENMLFTIREECKNPSLAKAVNQLQELAGKHYFSMPEYIEVEEKDKEHDQIWHCTCKIKEIDKEFKTTSLTKKEARKNAAYAMLLYVLKEEK